MGGRGESQSMRECSPPAETVLRCAYFCGKSGSYLTRLSLHDHSGPSLARQSAIRGVLPLAHNKSFWPRTAITMNTALYPLMLIAQWTQAQFSTGMNRTLSPTLIVLPSFCFRYERSFWKVETHKHLIRCLRNMEASKPALDNSS